MPATYDSIATHTFSGSTNTLTFSSIPQTFTDLVFVCQMTAANNTELRIRYNGDTANNYSRFVVEYANTSTSTFYQGPHSAFYMLVRTDLTTNILHVMDYANTSYYTESLARFNNVNAVVGFQVMAWKQNAAVSSVTFYTDDGSNFGSGGTISLYGILRA